MNSSVKHSAMSLVVSWSERNAMPFSSNGSWKSNSSLGTGHFWSYVALGLNSVRSVKQQGSQHKTAQAKSRIDRLFHISGFIGYSYVTPPPPSPLPVKLPARY